jgi:hypothetical protein
MASKYKIIDKIYFPKNVTIHTPGIIINKTSRVFGGIKSQKRCVYHFEDIFAGLQLETIKEIGKERASQLYYNIGKELGFGYMIIGKVKKPQKILLPFFLRHIFEVIKSNGTTVTEKVTFRDKNYVILEGSNNIVCRKTEDNSFFAGIFSGIFSYLLGENIEARGYCNCPDKCKIIISSHFPERYIPNLIKIKPMDNYSKINFPEELNFSKNMPSFEDFIKFKKAWIGEDGKHYFMNKVLITTEQNMFAFVGEHYLREGLLDILKRGILVSSEKLASDILDKKNTPEENLDILIRILCSFGFGIPHYEKKDKEIIFLFLYGPVANYPPLYDSLVLNGFINFIFNKRFELKKIDQKYSPSVTLFHYKEI